MSFKIFKYEQHEGGVFTKTNNLLNIQLPALEGITNMNASYLELEGVSFYDNAGEQVVENVALGMAQGASSVEYSSSAFVKNLKITSSKLPLIEEVRFVNRRTQSQHTLVKSETAIKNEYLLGRGGICVLDENGKCNLQVPLKEVCGFGSIGALSMTETTGDVNFQLELENQFTLASEYRQEIQITDAECADIDNASGGELQYNTATIQPRIFNSLAEAEVLFPIGSSLTINYTHSANGASQAQVSVSNVQVNGNVCTLTFNEAWLTLQDTEQATDIVLSNGVVSIQCADNDAEDPRNVLVAPAQVPGTEFPVGQVLLISCITDNNTWRVFTGVVESVVEEENDFAITFTKDILPAGALTDIYIRVMKFRNLDFEVEKINLVVRNNPSAPTSNAPIVFSTYHLEMVNMPPNYTDFRQQFDVEPGVQRLEWLTPVDSLVSVLDSVSSYRVSVNEIDTTNRDVELDTGNNSLYYDRLLQAYGNAIVNLNMVNFSRDTFVIAETLIPSNSRLMVNLRLYSNDPMTQKVVYLYKLLEVGM